MATQYFFRVDGSSLWRGRVRAGNVPEEVMREMLAQHESGSVMHHYWARELSLPKFRVLPGFRLLSEVGDDTARIRFDVCDDLRALIGRHGGELYVVQHPAPSTYAWELSRIQNAPDYLRTPRSLLTHDAVEDALRSGKRA